MNERFFLEGAQCSYQELLKSSNSSPLARDPVLSPSQINLRENRLAPAKIFSMLSVVQVAFFLFDFLDDSTINVHSPDAILLRS